MKAPARPTSAGALPPGHQPRTRPAPRPPPPPGGCHRKQDATSSNCARRFKFSVVTVSTTTDPVLKGRSPTSGTAGGAGTSSGEGHKSYAVLGTASRAPQIHVLKPSPHCSPHSQGGPRSSARRPGERPRGGTHRCRHPDLRRQPPQPRGIHVCRGSPRSVGLVTAAEQADACRYGENRLDRRFKSRVCHVPTTGGHIPGGGGPSHQTHGAKETLSLGRISQTKVQQSRPPKPQDSIKLKTTWEKGFPAHKQFEMKTSES